MQRVFGAALSIFIGFSLANDFIRNAAAEKCWEDETRLEYISWRCPLHGVELEVVRLMLFLQRHRNISGAIPNDTPDDSLGTHGGRKKETLARRTRHKKTKRRSDERSHFDRLRNSHLGRRALIMQTMRLRPTSSIGHFCGYSAPKPSNNIYNDSKNRKG